MLLSLKKKLTIWKHRERKEEKVMYGKASWSLKSQNLIILK